VLLRLGVVHSAATGVKTGARLARATFKDTDTAIYRFTHRG
jgi:hypothetical protein